MNKVLVTYFSASGVTANIAKEVAEAAGADLYEIRPETPYTKADLNWMDKTSRSSVEMSDKSIRSSLADKDAPVAGADTVLIGFPIWWYVARLLRQESDPVRYIRRQRIRQHRTRTAAVRTESRDRRRQGIKPCR